MATACSTERASGESPAAGAVVAAGESPEADAVVAHTSGVSS